MRQSARPASRRRLLARRRPRRYYPTGGAGVPASRGVARGASTSRAGGAAGRPVLLRPDDRGRGSAAVGGSADALATLGAHVARRDRRCLSPSPVPLTPPPIAQA